MPRQTRCDSHEACAPSDVPDDEAAHAPSVFSPLPSLAQTQADAAHSRSVFRFSRASSPPLAVTAASQSPPQHAHAPCASQGSPLASDAEGPFASAGRSHRDGHRHEVRRVGDSAFGAPARSRSTTSRPSSPPVSSRRAPPRPAAAPPDASAAGSPVSPLSPRGPPGLPWGLCPAHAAAQGWRRAQPPPGWPSAPQSPPLSPHAPPQSPARAPRTPGGLTRPAPQAPQSLRTWPGPLGPSQPPPRPPRAPCRSRAPPAVASPRVRTSFSPHPALPPMFSPLSAPAFAPCPAAGVAGSSAGGYAPPLGPPSPAEARAWPRGDPRLLARAEGRRPPASAADSHFFAWPESTPAGVPASASASRGGDSGVDRVAERFLEPRQTRASPSEAGERETVQTEEIGRGKKKPLGGPTKGAKKAERDGTGGGASSERETPIFEKHWSPEAAEEGLKRGLLVKGLLQVAAFQTDRSVLLVDPASCPPDLLAVVPYKRVRATATSAVLVSSASSSSSSSSGAPQSALGGAAPASPHRPQGHLLQFDLGGFVARNRALHGDIVAVTFLPRFYTERVLTTRKMLFPPSGSPSSAAAPPSLSPSSASSSASPSSSAATSEAERCARGAAEGTAEGAPEGAQGSRKTGASAQSERPATEACEALKPPAAELLPTGRVVRILSQGKETTEVVCVIPPQQAKIDAFLKRLREVNAPRKADAHAEPASQATAGTHNSEGAARSRAQARPEEGKTGADAEIGARAAQAPKEAAGEGGQTGAAHKKGHREKEDAHEPEDVGTKGRKTKSASAKKRDANPLAPNEAEESQFLKAQPRDSRLPPFLVPIALLFEPPPTPFADSPAAERLSASSPSAPSHPSHPSHSSLSPASPSEACGSALEEALATSLRPSPLLEAIQRAWGLPDESADAVSGASPATAALVVLRRGPWTASCGSPFARVDPVGLPTSRAALAAAAPAPAPPSSAASAAAPVSAASPVSAAASALAPRSSEARCLGSRGADDVLAEALAALHMEGLPHAWGFPAEIEETLNRELRRTCPVSGRPAWLAEAEADPLRIDCRPPRKQPLAEDGGHSLEAVRLSRRLTLCKADDASVDSSLARVAFPGSPAAAPYQTAALRAFTIDPPTAKDLDDAVSLVRIAPGGATGGEAATPEEAAPLFELGVHVADVSHFVPEGSLLDAEAALRATTVYLDAKVFPMLPAALSEGVCSLHSGVDRLAFSVFMTLNERGELLAPEVRSPRLAKTLIRTAARLDYSQVDGFLLAVPGALRPVLAASPFASSRASAACGGLLWDFLVRDHPRAFQGEAAPLAVEASGGHADENRLFWTGGGPLAAPAAGVAGDGKAKLADAATRGERMRMWVESKERVHELVGEIGARYGIPPAVSVDLVTAYFLTSRRQRLRQRQGAIHLSSAGRLSLCFAPDRETLKPRALAVKEVNPLSHLLVEESMIVANHCVANEILGAEREAAPACGGLEPRAGCVKNSCEPNHSHSTHTVGAESNGREADSERGGGRKAEKEAEGEGDEVGACETPWERGECAEAESERETEPRPLAFGGLLRAHASSNEAAVKYLKEKLDPQTWAGFQMHLREIGKAANAAEKSAFTAEAALKGEDFEDDVRGVKLSHLLDFLKTRLNPPVYNALCFSVLQEFFLQAQYISPATLGAGKQTASGAVRENPRRREEERRRDAEDATDGSRGRAVAGFSRASLRSRAASEPRSYAHWALCLSSYMHFTSPIRRYADLHIHRLLSKRLRGEAMTLPVDVLEAACRQCNDNSRKADDAQTAFRSWYFNAFLRDHHPEGICYSEASILKIVVPSPSAFSPSAPSSFASSSSSLPTFSPSSSQSSPSVDEAADESGAESAGSRGRADGGGEGEQEGLSLDSEALGGDKKETVTKEGEEVGRGRGATQASKKERETGKSLRTETEKEGNEKAKAALVIYIPLLQATRSMSLATLGLELVDDGLREEAEKEASGRERKNDGAESVSAIRVRRIPSSLPAQRLTPALPSPPASSSSLPVESARLLCGGAPPEAWEDEVKTLRVLSPLHVKLVPGEAQWTVRLPFWMPAAEASRANSASKTA